MKKAKHKYNKGDVINLKSELKSLGWNDGLFVVYRIKGKYLYLVKLHDDYTMMCFDDGEPMCTVMGVDTKGIHKTNLKWEF